MSLKTAATLTMYALRDLATKQLISGPGPFFNELGGRQKTYDGSGTELLEFECTFKRTVKVAPLAVEQERDEKTGALLFVEETDEKTGAVTRKPKLIIPDSILLVKDGKPVAPPAAKVRKVRAAVAAPVFEATDLGDPASDAVEAADAATGTLTSVGTSTEGLDANEDAASF